MESNLKIPETVARMKPTADRVLVALDVGKQTTASGLYLPPSAQELQQTGRVLAVGPDVKHVRTGARVLTDAAYGLMIDENTLTRQRWVLYAETELLAVLDDEETISDSEVAG